MSKDCTTASGVYHVILKIKGEQRRVDLFHELLRRCDPSWPWKSGMYSRVQQCDCCEGLCFSSPRINASDVKSAAKQAAVKVTIVRFAPSEKCYSLAEQYQHTRWVEVEKTHTLYRSKAWLEQHAPHRGVGVQLLAPGDTPVVIDPGDTPKIVNIGTVRPTTHTIYPDGTCECVCHDRPTDLKFTHTTGSGCCGRTWKPREHPVIPPVPAIVSAAAVTTPNGEIIDAAPEVVDIPTGERRLIDHVVEAEREAARATGVDHTMWYGDDEPWGGLVN